MERPDDALKPIAARLAELLASEDGARILALLQQARERADRSRPAPAAAPAAHGFGIWEPESDGGRAGFVRSKKRLHEWTYWADIERIPPKGDRFRVVFLGESVARGFFYDPSYTPAGVLESLLNSIGGFPAAEVLDLACTDMSLDRLEALARRLPELEPDAVVVFAGNNWDFNWRNPAFRREIAFLLRRGGTFAVVRRFAELMLRQAVERFLGGLARIARELRVPVVVLVPEFNLGDWTWGAIPAFWLPKGANARWLGARAAATRALARGDLRSAERAAKRMNRLDEGTNPTAWEILGRCRLRNGDPRRARRLLEQARDALVIEDLFHPPAPFSVVQEALRGAAGSGIEVVDLPKVFEAHLSGSVPDRRLFLDYCHLSAEGVRLAMAATAERLAKTVTPNNAPPVRLSDAAPAPDGRTEAEARFMAAIHNAHWGQGYELCRFHTGEALRRDATIADAMLEFMDFQLRPQSSLLCESFLRLLPRSRGIKRYLELSNEMKLLDVPLMRALTDSLEDAGVRARARYERLMTQAHAVGADRKDLTEARYSLASFAGHNPHAGKLAHIEALDHESTFRFYLSAARPVLIEAACRAPLAPGAAKAVLDVNGRRVGAWPVSKNWSTRKIAIPGRALRPGVNVLSIRWTAPPRGDEPFRRFADRLELGEVPPLRPAFGQVQALSVRLERSR